MLVNSSVCGHLSGSIEQEAEVAALPAWDEAGALVLDAHQGTVDAKTCALLPHLCAPGAY